MENATPITREDVQALVQQLLHEQAEGELAKRQAALDEKETALKNQQQLENALTLCRQHGLPETLAPALANLQDMAAAAQEWENLFRAAVQQAVEERLRGDAPATGVMQDVSTLSDQDYYASVYPHLT